MSGETRVALAALLRAAQDGAPGPHLRADGAGPLLPLDGVVVLGRGAEAGLQLDDPLTSRRHARLTLAPDGRARVQDLGSKNGCRLNGRPLGRRPRALAPGDVLEVGATRLVFHDPLAEARSPALRPPGPQARPPRAPPWLAALLLATAAALLALAA